MRYDSIGLFWKDEPAQKKAKAVKEKKEPPEPVWLHPDFIPNVEKVNLDLIQDSELAFWDRDDKFVTDVECYPNYFLIMLTSVRTGRVLFEEAHPTAQLNIAKLDWMFSTFGIVTFNGIGYDVPMITLALHGFPTGTLKQASDDIIKGQLRPSFLLKKYRVKARKFDNIDLIEVAPLKANLKIYGGRLHVKKMQDLPFHDAAMLNEVQRNIVRDYCFNDTVNTAFLYMSLQEELNVRIALSKEYGIDLRSKSDAQIAEHVISKEVAKINGDRIKPDEIPAGSVFKYKAPKNVSFQTPLLQDALRIIEAADYVVKEDGAIDLPKQVKALKLSIADNVYRMGIGGLHSSETNLTLKSNDEYELIDRDVKSYYPSIILNLMLFPVHLGRAFLKVYRTIVVRRLKAKEQGIEVEAGTLKIVINGTFGKLMSKYSDIYAPDLGLKVTIGGQLYLLMLIEKLVLSGLRVVSANTDGIVIYCHKSMKEKLSEIIAWWEKLTGFETEETKYSAMFIRDVNNYMAVKAKDGKIKEKGAYANPWKSNSTQEMLKKNPTNLICIEALQKFLIEAKSIEQTIKECTDVTKFITVRGVSGGAVKDGEYLGKSIRWYYAQGEKGEIVYAKNGNKVPRSDGAKPLMNLNGFPQDIDYDWYINETYEMLKAFEPA